MTFDPFKTGIAPALKDQAVAERRGVRNIVAATRPRALPAEPPAMSAECACGHTLQRHSLYDSCDEPGCDCDIWSPALPWYAEVVSTCICGEPVHRNDPRRGADFNERHVVCHLDCAPEPPAPAPWPGNR